MDEGDTGIYLTNRGWSIGESLEKADAHIVTWEFGRKYNSKASDYESQAYFSIYNVLSLSRHYIIYLPNDDKAFRDVLNNAISLKMRRVNYTNEGGKITYVYEGSKYIVDFETRTVSKEGRIISKTNMIRLYPKFGKEE